MSFLNNSSYSFIVIFYCLIGLSFTFILFVSIRKFSPNFVVPSGDSDFMAGLHSALFTITFLTLGYSLANVAETVDNYQQTILTEANEIKKLDVLLSFYNNKETSLIRKDLRNYASSIVNDEWPQLANNQ
jgi:hypothetical protein